MSENLVRSIYLGIGSNLGNKKSNIEKVKSKLIQHNINIKRSSFYYESLSWPDIKNPKFLNIVVEICTNLSPLKLLKKCKEIEVNLGRKKSAKNSPRICDVDIIDYMSIKKDEDLILPHPRMHTRNFVLIPLFELDKKWIHPVSKYHIKRLILSLSNRDIRTIKQF